MSFSSHPSPDCCFNTISNIEEIAYNAISSLGTLTDEAKVGDQLLEEWGGA